MAISSCSEVNYEHNNMEVIQGRKIPKMRTSLYYWDEPALPPTGNCKEHVHLWCTQQSLLNNSLHFPTMIFQGKMSFIMLY